MRLHLLIIIFLLVMPGALAANLFSQWIYPGDTFTYDGDLFSMSKGSDPYQILITKDDDQRVLEWPDCDRAANKLIEYCFNESDYIECQRRNYDCPDNDEETDPFWCCPHDVTHVRFDAGGANWATYLIIRDVQPKLTVTREPEKTLLELNEKSSVKVTFENTGHEIIRDAEYRELIPEGFTVVNTFNFKREQDGLSLLFSIGPGTEETFLYWVKPVEYVSGVFKGNATYTYLGEEETILPTTFTINVPSPFKITRDFEPAEPSIGEKCTYLYTLENQEAEDMEVSIVFTGLTELIDALPDEVFVDDGNLVWEGRLDSDEIIELEFPFLISRTGTYVVEEDATMVVNNEEFFHRAQDSLSVSVKEVTPEIRFSTSSPDAGQNITVRVLLDNKDGDTDYFKMKGMLTGDLLNAAKIYSLDTVSYGVHPLVGEHIFTLPLVESQQKYSFTFAGTYETKFGETFSYATTSSVTASAYKAPFVITQKVNQSTVIAGDSFEMVVTVKNQGSAYKTVSVTDILPSGAHVRAGTRENEMSLNEDEVREAYTYQVTVPESYDVGIFTVTTRLYDQQGETFYEERVNVTVKDLPMPTTTEPEPEPEVKPPPEPEPEKKGFFRRIIDGIIGFFENLF
ncbi:hypothetical protein GOV07_01570 [Candidatus Woesearchaeota archaeon]|nr:hypothetical protein [Candidatus Woesearchaeota archaeon]